MLGSSSHSGRSAHARTPSAARCSSDRTTGSNATPASSATVRSSTSNGTAGVAALNVPAVRSAPSRTSQSARSRASTHCTGASSGGVMCGPGSLIRTTHAVKRSVGSCGPAMIDGRTTVLPGNRSATARSHRALSGP